MDFTEKRPKPIKTEFMREGMRHHQIRRQGNVAMFEVGKGGGYEVVVIRVAKPQKLPTGDMAPWRETYPGNEEFGHRGWYFNGKYEQMALAKFESLVSSHGKN